MAAGTLSAAFAADSEARMPLGFNTYSLRLMGWDDATALQYAADHKLDAIFLQDSKDPRAMDPTHWPEVKARAADLGFRFFCCMD